MWGPPSAQDYLFMLFRSTRLRASTTHTAAHQSSTTNREVRLQPNVFIKTLLHTKHRVHEFVWCPSVIIYIKH